MREKCHYALTAVLFTAIFPLFRHFHLPLVLSFGQTGFVLYITMMAIAVAGFMYVAAVPATESLGLFRAPCWRLLLLPALFADFRWIFGWPLEYSILAALDGLILVEVFRRCRARRAAVLASAAIPVLYLAVGIMTVFYLDAVVLARGYSGTADRALNAMDARLFFGATVPALVHAFLKAAPAGAFGWLELIYVGMFFQLGASLFFLGVGRGMREAMRLAGTILMAYYISLLIYCLWPSQGPYAICPGHFARFPASSTRFYQQLTLDMANALWAHKPPGEVEGYYISFPCMHITQPAITLWFLRPWRRLTLLLIVYDVLLAAAIILLEWHYFVDVLGGFAVAAAAIWVVNYGRIRQRQPAPLPALPDLAA